MATKKTTAVSNSRAASIGTFVKTANPYLAFVFLVIWVLIGLFLLLVIAGSVRLGALNNLLGGTQASPAPLDVPQQTEANLPGVGKVNIACTEAALSTEAIGKVLDTGNTSGLTAEEMAKFEPCIVEKEATPAPSPAN